MRRELSIITGICFLVLLSVVQGKPQDQAASKPLRTQTSNDIEVSIWKVEKMKTWENPMSTPLSKDSYDAPSGQEWVVFHVAIKSTKNKDVSFKSLLLSDADGKKYKSLLNELTASGPPDVTLEMVFEVPFLVPEGAKTKNLKIQDFSFDLEGLEVLIKRSTPLS